MKYASLIIVSLMLAACEQHDTRTETNARNEQAARGMFDAFNQHSWDKMAGYYVDTARFLDPSFGQQYVAKTRKETAAKYRQMQQMFPDIHDELKSVTASGDKVFVEFVSSGSAKGQKWTLPICTILTFKSGLIISDATYYDNSMSSAE
ncbi:nuclear transport factor 2 family protein [Mucilaginibacter agri]|uniref:Nuclear transport factor 2 family protein n=1 Tax=Mucilaginibacter agri TaxID=2695265 RepID=A0A965ZG95_9SPHI|nr:nuclear transport factor 2 family protein [Mucilaginibacter agri]NCD69628.1 nuclear transport factor 2 family protein [Mucilaginibacter agri]